jgi:hypothetical protein
MVLPQRNTKSAGLLPRKISSFLWPVKDDLELRTLGVYIAFCEWDKVCSGWKSCSINSRLKDHHKHFQVEHPEKSAMAEHINLGHHIQLTNTSLISSKPRYMDCIMRAATEHHQNHMNCFLKECTKLLSQNSIHGFSTKPQRPRHTVPIRVPTVLSWGTHQYWAFLYFPEILLLFLGLFRPPPLYVCLQPKYRITFSSSLVLCSPHTH